MDLHRFVEPKSTALLVIDIQYDYCSQQGRLPTFRKYSTKPIEKMIPKLAAFIDTARKQNLKVIWTRMIENSVSVPQNLRLKMESSKTNHLDLCIKGSKGFDYYLIHPGKGDKEIEKNQYDAFTNPELEVYLHSFDIKNIIFTGVYTARCVDSTLRGASGRGYNCVVPQDLVGSVAELSNERNAALNVWNSIFAYVVESQDIIKTWSK